MNLKDETIFKELLEFHHRIEEHVGSLMLFLRDEYIRLTPDDDFPEEESNSDRSARAKRINTLLKEIGVSIPGDVLRVICCVLVREILLLRAPAELSRFLPDTNANDKRRGGTSIFEPLVPLLRFVCTRTAKLWGTLYENFVKECDPQLLLQVLESAVTVAKAENRRWINGQDLRKAVSVVRGTEGNPADDVNPTVRTLTWLPLNLCYPQLRRRGRPPTEPSSMRKTTAAKKLLEDERRERKKAQEALAAAESARKKAEEGMPPVRRTPLADNNCR